MYTGVGVMSGSSLDGIDLCCVELLGDEDADYWKFKVLKSETVPYSSSWHSRLQSSCTLSGAELCQLHMEYGHLLGKAIKQFMDENADIDDIKFVSVHGHTVFHQPDKGFTFQLGDGEAMSSHLEVPVVTNLRAKDVALGGQGSPLMLVGDRHLFSECNIFLNLGGSCDISLEGKAFEVVPCNIMLNHLAEQLQSGQHFDDEGKVAASGKVIPEVLMRLNGLPYYALPPPKTLGREWFNEFILPVLDTKAYSCADLLRTAVEHIADQISRAISIHARDNSADFVRLENALLITGGGAFNTFLMEKIAESLSCLSVPVTIWGVNDDIIKYKEAIIMSFIGLRTLLGQTNTDCSVTGGRSDAICGSVHLPPSGRVLPPHINKVCPFHIMRKKSRASTISFGSTEQLGIPALLSTSPEENPAGLMDEPRRLMKKRTFTQ